MTLIEIYDNTPLENLIGILTLCPEKAIVVGTEQPMLVDIQYIKRVLEMKGLSVTLETRVVDPFDVHGTRQTFETIAQIEPSCVFDLTGGDERLIAAATSVAEQYKLQSQHMHIPSGVATDIDGDGTLAPITAPSLTVRELITLHGGAVTACTSSPACTDQEAEALWNLTRNHPREWNSHIKLLMTLEKGHYRSQTVSLSPHDIPKHAKQRFTEIRSKLNARGIIHNQSTPDEIRYTYTKPYFRSLLEKAGNLLEHKSFYEAQATMYEGNTLFNDVCMGVSIDWNDTLRGNQKVTNNEIDLLLMCGVRPLFVSCKNGDVDENELYKLATVADRFGGKYARKMLIVTELEPDSPQAREALTRRAADMSIHLVANAGRLSPEEWKAEFLKAMGLG